MTSPYHQKIKFEQKKLLSLSIIDEKQVRNKGSRKHYDG